MNRPFQPPKGGADLTAGVQAMTAVAIVQAHAAAVQAQLELALLAPDDAEAFAALAAARASITALQDGMRRLREAVKPLMASDPQLARELAPILGDDLGNDACGIWAARANEIEEQVRRTRFGRTAVGRA